MVMSWPLRIATLSKGGIPPGYRRTTFNGASITFNGKPVFDNGTRFIARPA